MNCHRSQGLIFRLNFNLFLSLNGLVQAFGEAAAGHHASGKFINQDDFAILDDIVLIQRVERIGPERLIDMMDQRNIGRIVKPGSVLGDETTLGQDFFDPLRTHFRQQDLTLFFIEFKGFRIDD